eukprot:1452133-Rhodomonas_salina.1
MFCFVSEPQAHSSLQHALRSSRAVISLRKSVKRGIGRASAERGWEVRHHLRARCKVRDLHHVRVGDNVSADPSGRQGAHARGKHCAYARTAAGSRVLGGWRHRKARQQVRPPEAAACRWPAGARTLSRSLRGDAEGLLEERPQLLDALLMHPRALAAARLPRPDARVGLAGLALQTPERHREALDRRGLPVDAKGPGDVGGLCR